MADLALQRTATLDIQESYETTYPQPASVALDAGAMVYFDGTTGGFRPADATTRAKARIVGMAWEKKLAAYPVTALVRGVVGGFVLDAGAYGAPVYLSDTADAGALTLTNPAKNQKNSITITGTPTGGTFTITVTHPARGALTTATIAYDADAAAVKTALDAILGAGQVLVTGTGPFTLEFVNSLAKQPITVAASGAALTGGTSPAATAAVVQAGILEVIVGRIEPVRAQPKITDSPDKLLRLFGTTLF